MEEKNTFADSDDPEIRDLLRRIDAAKRKGLIKDPPRSRKAVRSLEDLCRYVFKLTHLSGTYQMLIEENRVRRWVWEGHDFSDKTVHTVRDLAPQVPDLEMLEELRLVNTRVSADGAERLRRLFPSTRITTYLMEDGSDWGLAFFNGQAGDEWRVEMINLYTRYLED
jgi:hypothetical protein